MFTLRDDNQFLFVCPIVPQFVRTELQLRVLQSLLQLDPNSVEKSDHCANLKKRPKLVTLNPIFGKSIWGNPIWNNPNLNNKEIIFETDMFFFSK